MHLISLSARIRAIAASAGAAVFLSLPAHAVDGTVGSAEIVPVAVVEEVGASERINFSGKLRMLSQRIPSAACHLASGIDVEGSTKLLKGATAEFQKILDGLEFGDADLKIIGEEKRRKTLVRIADLREKWAPMQAAAEGMVAGDITEENLNIVLGENMTVLGSAKLLVSELTGQYSDPSAMLQADSMLIDISGRQRMLTQKMSKENCMLRSAHTAESTVGDLTGTMQMFEVSLMALRNGMDQAGIAPPPNQEISDGLDVVIGNWGTVKPALEAQLAGTSADDVGAVTLFQDLNTTMANMNKVVGLYTAASKLGL